jgi:hypothetical protein
MEAEKVWAMQTGIAVPIMREIKANEISLKDIFIAVPLKA